MLTASLFIKLEEFKEEAVREWSGDVFISLIARDKHCLAKKRKERKDRQAVSNEL